ncbi:MAG: hypothetical protein Q9M92_11600 [Enterobacterales bacterium]|nr:hypothetical protein [Enterobacterales bacterium]
MKFSTRSVTLFAAMMTVFLSLNLAANPSGKQGHSKHSYAGGKHSKMTVKRILKHLEPLNLSKEQVKSVKQIVKSGKELSKPLRKSLKQQHKNLKMLGKSDAIDEQAIRDTSQQIAAIKADLMILHMNKKQQIRALLNEQQQAQLLEMKQQRRAMKQKHRTDDNS